MVIKYIRSNDKKIKGASNIYDCLVSSYHIPGDWLARKSGDGRSIRVGEDPFIGEDSDINYAHIWYVFFTPKVLSI